MVTKTIKLRDVATALGLSVGCGDNSCVWGSPGGMGTNGGCRCYGSRGDRDYRIGFLEMQRVAKHLLEVYNVLNPKKDDQ